MTPTITALLVVYAIGIPITYSIIWTILNKSKDPEAIPTALVAAIIWPVTILLAVGTYIGDKID